MRSYMMPLNRIQTSVKNMNEQKKHTGTIKKTPQSRNTFCTPYSKENNLKTQLIRSHSVAEKQQEFMTRLSSTGKKEVHNVSTKEYVNKRDTTFSLNLSSSTTVETVGTKTPIM